MHEEISGEIVRIPKSTIGPASSPGDRHMRRWEKWENPEIFKQCKKCDDKRSIEWVPEKSIFFSGTREREKEKKDYESSVEEISMMLLMTSPEKIWSPSIRWKEMSNVWKDYKNTRKNTCRLREFLEEVKTHEKKLDQSKSEENEKEKDFHSLEWTSLDKCDPKWCENMREIERNRDDNSGEEKHRKIVREEGRISREKNNFVFYRFSIHFSYAIQGLRLQNQ